MKTFLKWCEATNKKDVLEILDAIQHGTLNDVPRLDERGQRTALKFGYPKGYGTRDAAMTDAEANTIAADAPINRQFKGKGKKKKK